MCFAEVEFHYTDEERKRPEVPKKEEQPLMGLKSTKDFITTNAVQNITSVPKRPEKIFVDTKKGDKNYLDPSGLEPVFVHKKVYIVCLIMHSCKLLLLFGLCYARFFNVILSMQDTCSYIFNKIRTDVGDCF